MTAALVNLLLAALGLPVVVGGVALVARHLVYRHADQHGPAIRAAGRDLPTRREAAARRAADRPKELTR
ncbi:hypothetical protein AB0I37_14330 [Micromonospora purpureochromogenes]|uniref:hypothetical protein n=1 Tax=Micromonospora purpureochromogenes TaxID=47872 RepID=UPI003410D9DB